MFAKLPINRGLQPPAGQSRLSLLALLVFSLLLVVVLFRWISGTQRWLRHTWREHDAIEAIEEAGGHYHFDWFDEWGEVSFRTLDDATLKSISGSLAVLDKCEDLDALYLAGTQISDNGLEGLSALHNLSKLYLRNTPVSGKGLVHLRNIENLRTLDLSGTNVTDAGFASLSELPGIHRLLLDPNQLSPVAVHHLGTIPRPLQIDLRGRSVTDEALLGLIPQLRELSNLGSMGLLDTATTPQAQEMFRARLPEVSLGVDGHWKRESCTNKMPTEKLDD